MKLVRSNTPEADRWVPSGGVRASRRWPAFVYGFFLNALILLIALALSLSISVHAAAWVGVPALLAWNAYLLWRTKSSRLNWFIAARADRIYIRLLMTPDKSRGDVLQPYVIMLEASDIASISVRTVEVFLYGPKPKIVEWLVIKPDQAVAESVCERIRPLPEPTDPSRQLHVVNEEERLITGWKWCHPALRAFLHQVTRECPSVTIGKEERSELDLNRIWVGISMDLSARQRQMLVQARRLGFGPECRRLLCRYKYIPFREAQRYMAQLEQEDAGTGRPAA